VNEGGKRRKGNILAGLGPRFSLLPRRARPLLLRDATPALLAQIDPQLPRGIDRHVAVDEAIAECREHADPVRIHQEAWAGVPPSARSRSIRMLIRSNPVPSLDCQSLLTQVETLVAQLLGGALESADQLIFRMLKRPRDRCSAVQNFIRW
jgi:hypothetical protein